MKMKSNLLGDIFLINKKKGGKENKKKTYNEQNLKEKH